MNQGGAPNGDRLQEGIPNTRLLNIKGGFSKLKFAPPTTTAGPTGPNRPKSCDITSNWEPGG
eukprot:342120-Lingulodinium_polyedra.AAC.1